MTDSDTSNDDTLDDVAADTGGNNDKFGETVQLLQDAILKLQQAFPEFQQSVSSAETLLTKLAREQPELATIPLEPSLKKTLERVTLSINQVLAEMNEMFAATDLRLNHSKEFAVDAIRVQFLDILEEQLQEAERNNNLQKVFFPLLNYTTETIIKHELSEKKRLVELLGETKQAYQIANKRIIFLTQKIQKYEKQEVGSKAELLDQIGTLRAEFTEYSHEHNAKLYLNLSEKLEEIEHATYNSLQDVQEKYQEVLEVIRGEKTDIQSSGLQHSFETLIRDLIHFEMEQMGQFGRLLRADLLQVINEELNNKKDDPTLYNNFIPLIEETTRQIIDVKLRDEKRFAELLREDLLQVINEELNSKKDEPGIYDNFIPLIEETARQIIDIKLRDEKRFSELLRTDLLQVINEELKKNKDDQTISDDIITIIGQIVDVHLKKQHKFSELLRLDLLRVMKEELANKDGEDIKDKFLPLIEAATKEIIDTELDTKGRFVRLLTEKIIEISEAKESALEDKFKIIVEKLVGKGTQQNEKLAKHNTVLGLRSLTESDIDDLLGNKIVKIVDKKSAGFGTTVAKSIADFGEKINSIITFGGKPDTAKQFIDGFSFSIYYYVLINGDTTIRKDTLLPKEFMKEKHYYIGTFDKFIADREVEREAIISKDPESYKNHTKILPVPVEGTNSTQEIFCYSRYIGSNRVYYFLNTEPSAYFKSQITKILEKYRKSSALNSKLKQELEELSKSYTIPKVDIAIFNSKDLDLPSDDGNSVIASKNGRMTLNPQEKVEISTILGNSRKHFDSFSSVWSKLKPRFIQKPGFFSKKITRFIPHFGEYDYIGSSGVWYFWVKNNPQKLLVVKTIKPLSKKIENNQISEADNFINYVNRDIWSKLVETKNLGEMQDWVNVFVQKDTGMFSSTPGLSRLLLWWKRLTKTAYIAIISSLLLFIYHNWVPTSDLIADSKNTAEKTIYHSWIPFHSAVKELRTDIYSDLTGHIDRIRIDRHIELNRIKLLEDKISVIISENMKLEQAIYRIMADNFTKLDEALIDDILHPFKFPPMKQK